MSRDSSIKCQNKQGHLYKKGAGKLAGWSERLFVLKGGSLSYYDGDKLKGSIATRDIQIVRETQDSAGSWSDRKQPCRFEIVTPERVFFLSAETYKKQHLWMKAIDSWIGMDTPVTRSRTRTVTAADEHGAHKCKLCGSTYALPEDLVVHVSLRHAPGTSKVDKVARCDVCGNTYSNAADLDHHRRARHGMQSRGGPPPRATASSRNLTTPSTASTPNAGSAAVAPSARPALQRVFSSPVGVVASGGHARPPVRRAGGAPPFGGVAAGAGALQQSNTPSGAAADGDKRVPQFKCFECMKAYFTEADLATHNQLRHGAAGPAPYLSPTAAGQTAAAAPGADRGSTYENNISAFGVSSPDADAAADADSAKTFVSPTMAEWDEIDAALECLDLAL